MGLGGARRPSEVPGLLHEAVPQATGTAWTPGVHTSSLVLPSETPIRSPHSARGAPGRPPCGVTGDPMPCEDTSLPRTGAREAEGLQGRGNRAPGWFINTHRAPHIAVVAELGTEGLTPQGAILSSGLRMRKLEPREGQGCGGGLMGIWRDS